MQMITGHRNMIFQHSKTAISYFEWSDFAWTSLPSNEHSRAEVCRGQSVRHEADLSKFALFSLW